MGEKGARIVLQDNSRDFVSSYGVVDSLVHIHYFIMRFSLRQSDNVCFLFPFLISSFEASNTLVKRSLSPPLLLSVLFKVQIRVHLHAIENQKLGSGGCPPTATVITTITENRTSIYTHTHMEDNLFFFFFAFENFLSLIK